MSRITEAVRFFLDPFNILWLLGLGMIVLWALDKKPWLKRLTIFTVLFFLIVSTPLIPVILVNSLEDRYLPLDIEQFQTGNEYDTHIVVLGGGHSYDERRLPANALLSSNARGRLMEGIRLHRQIPGSKMVLSGSTSTPGRLTQAEMLKETALLLGVVEDWILLQKEPKNTCQEARDYSALFGRENSQVILVTSAMHMARAEKLFEDFGVDVTPSATNYQLKGSWKRKRFGLPSVKNISLLTSAIKTYAAMAEARLSSRFIGGCR